jgi:hypothetical protein
MRTGSAAVIDNTPDAGLGKRREVYRLPSPDSPRRQRARLQRNCREKTQKTQKKD